MLHTAPHHDDIMLAYLGWIRRMLDRDHPDVPEEDRTRHCFLLLHVRFQLGDERPDGNLRDDCWAAAAKAV